MTTDAKISARFMAFAIFYIFICPVILFALAGDWTWRAGWIFSVWLVVLSETVLVYLYRHDPALLLERGRQPGMAGQKRWDVYVIYLIQFGFWAWLIIMPLDAVRYHWTRGFPAGLRVAGGIGLIGAFFFLYRAFTDNTFLSAMVRIQSERQHRVVTTGVYAFVRHPMYLGAVLLFIGSPLLLNSRVGLLVGVIMSLLLMARSIGEEKMLMRELEGYEEYRKKVKYRLVPGVW